MKFPVYMLLACSGLFVLTLGAYELGRKLGRKRIARGQRDSDTGVVDAAVFALLGLLVAFTFSGAATRFDGRKQLIIDETNSIGTAYKRIDLLPAAAQPELRASFRRYLDGRLAAYAALPDADAARAELAKNKVNEDDIWHQALADAAAAPSPAATILIVNALNTMFDIANTRTLVTEIHPPKAIFVMLAALILIGAMLVGEGVAGQPRSWLRVLGLAAVMTITVYVILDLEYPRLGVFHVAKFDQALRELRQAMR
jgi:hypothetical protein